MRKLIPKKKLLLPLLIIPAILVVLYGCSPEPEPIRFGSDLCVYCKMMISDTRYGGEMVTIKGKVYKYDSIECLAASYLKGEINQAEIHSLWTVDFAQPEKLIDAKQALYLQSKDLHSPMGLNLSAFAEQATAEKVERLYIGSLLGWDEVQKVVQQKWLDKESKAETNE